MLFGSRIRQNSDVTGKARKSHDFRYKITTACSIRNASPRCPESLGSVVILQADQAAGGFIRTLVDD